MILFNFEGEEMVASAVRKVDYENQSVPVSIFYDGSHFEKGTYKVDIYIDGRHSGSQETYFE
jgi:outer membrane usher protein FimD/PapC